MGEEFIIEYISDISDIAAKAREIERINKIAAQQLGKDFSGAIDIISKRLERVRNTTITVNGEEVAKEVQTFATVVQTADGNLLKFKEDVTLLNGEFEKSAQTFSLLKAPISQAEKEQQKLLGTSSRLATNFANLTDVNRKFASELRNVGNVNKFIGTTLKTVSDNGSRTSTIFETVNGKIVQLTETVKRLPNGVQEVTRTTKEMNKAQLANVTTLERGKLETRSFTDNLSTLLKRAALTIPVWFAIRQGIASIFRTIRDGLGTLVEFERSLAKIRQNLLATSSDVTRDLRILRNEFTQLAIESGVSADTIANAFQKFATVGFDFEDSLAGAINSTKLAVTLFGDAEETADAFSRALRILVDQQDATKSSADQIAEAMALTSELWKTNQFDINEVNAGLEKFAAVAKVTNLSMQQTLTLLATLGTAATGGARGGTLLRTSFQKLLENLDDVSRELGVNITQFDDSFSIILKVTDSLASLGDEFDAVVERSRVLNEVFGGVRGSLPIQALTSLNDVLQENAKLVGDVNKFNKEFDDLTESLPILVDRFRELNTQIGKAFVTGIVGGDNFEASLSKIIETQEKLLGNAEKLGGVFRNTFLVSGVASLVLFRKEIGKLFAFVASRLGGATGLLGTGAVLTVLNFKEEANRLEREAREANQDFVALGARIGQSINKGFAQELSIDELTNLISDIEVFGPTQLGFDEATLERALERLKVELAIAKAKERQVEETKKQIPNQEKLNELNETILEDALDRFQAQGALQSQLIKQELALRNQLGLELEGADLLEKQLSLQRAINEERRLGEGTIDESIKLFRIAQEEGIGIARAIGEVLAGQKDFNTFIRRGGKELEVFKRDFGDIFEQQQARAFFRGETFGGRPSVRGGAGVPLFGEATSLRGVSVGVDRQTEINQQVARAMLEDKAATQTNTTAIQENTEQLRILNQIQSTERFIGNIPVQNVTSAGTAKPSAQTFDINININGQNLRLFGTEQNIRGLANQLGDEAKRQVEQLINDIANNPQSSAAQAVDKRINEF